MQIGAGLGLLVLGQACRSNDNPHWEGTPADVSLVGPAESLDPWPASCVPEAYRDRPAGRVLLTGPSLPGREDRVRADESYTATLNGLPRAFIDFLDTHDDRPSGGSFVIEGIGGDGSVAVGVPSLEPGSYACGKDNLGYLNDLRDDRLYQEGLNVYMPAAQGCCQIQITGSGAVGEPISGTFSGILIDDSLETWIKVEAGAFTVIRQDAPVDAGAATD
jgi:hypothetical protein